MLATVCSSTAIHFSSSYASQEWPLWTSSHTWTFKTRWGFHVNLVLCVCSACVYLSCIHEEPYMSILFQVRTRWRGHADPTLSAMFVTLYRNVIYLHQDNCLFCLCTIVLTTWRTIEFLLLHEDLSDHPTPIRNAMEVTCWPNFTCYFSGAVLENHWTTSTTGTAWVIWTYLDYLSPAPSWLEHIALSYLCCTNCQVSCFTMWPLFTWTVATEMTLRCTTTFVIVNF